MRIGKLHILILPSWYPLPEDPAAGIFFQDQAVALSKAGHRIGVIHPYVPSLKSCLRRHDKIIKQVVSQDKFGIKLYRYSGIPLTMFHKLNLRQKTMIGSMLYKRYVRENGTPDLIHAHVTYPAGIIAAVLKRKYKIPIVITEHSTAISSNSVPPWQVPLIKESLLISNQCIVVSPALGQHLKTICNFEYRWIPNLVDTDYFTPDTDMVSTKPGASDRFIFLFIGYLVPRKGVHLLLQAFEHACKGKQSELWIGGEGIEKGNLELQAQSLGIASQVKFIGMLHRKEVRDALRKCDTLVLPSLNETFGVVLIEAFSCGKPVIATRCGGPDFIVNEHNGFLVPTGDVSQLAESMKKMITNYHLFNPRVIREDCVARFGEQHIVSKLESVYFRAMKSNVA